MAADDERQDNVTQLPPTSADTDRNSTTDAHTRDRWAWLDQVLADRELTPLAFSVAYVIASHVNRDTGEAWPSQARIAEMVGSTERGVRKTVEQLVAQGHVIVTTPNGRKGVNRYRPAMRRQAEVIDFHRNGGSGNGSLHRNAGSCETRSHRNDGSHEQPRHRNGGSGNGAFHRNETADFIGTVVPPNPMREPSENITLDPKPEAPPEPIAEPKAKHRKTKAKPDGSGFAEAYELYPRHVGPDDARRAYDKALAGGTTREEILAGVRRYAAERAGEPQRFTAHMASWLNAGRWKDGQPLTAVKTVGSENTPVFEAKGIIIPEANIIIAIERWRKGGGWLDVWGPPPSDPACRIPRPILDRAGVAR